MIVVKYGPSRLMPALYMPFQCALEINKFEMSGFGHIVLLSLHSQTPQWTWRLMSYKLF